MSEHVRVDRLVGVAFQGEPYHTPEIRVDRLVGVVFVPRTEAATNVQVDQVVGVAFVARAVEEAPTADEITADLVAPGAILTQVLTPGTGTVDTREFHIGATAGFTPGPSTLFSSGDADLFIALAAPVPTGTTRYLATVVINSAGSAISNVVAVVVPATTPPTKPTLTLVADSETPVSALFDRSAYHSSIDAAHSVSLLRIEERDGTHVLTSEVELNEDLDVAAILPDTYSGTRLLQARLQDVDEFYVGSEWSDPEEYELTEDELPEEPEPDPEAEPQGIVTLLEYRRKWAATWGWGGGGWGVVVAPNPPVGARTQFSYLVGGDSPSYDRVQKKASASVSRGPIKSGRVYELWSDFWSGHGLLLQARVAVPLAPDVPFFVSPTPVPGKPVTGVVQLRLKDDPNNPVDKTDPLLLEYSVNRGAEWNLVADDIEYDEGEEAWIPTFDTSELTQRSKLFFRATLNGETRVWGPMLVVHTPESTILHRAGSSLVKSEFAFIGDGEDERWSEEVEAEKEILVRTAVGPTYGFAKFTPAYQPRDFTIFSQQRSIHPTPAGSVQLGFFGLPFGIHLGNRHGHGAYLEERETGPSGLLTWVRNSAQAFPYNVAEGSGNGWWWTAGRLGKGGQRTEHDREVPGGTTTGQNSGPGWYIPGIGLPWIFLETRYELLGRKLNGDHLLRQTTWTYGPDRDSSIPAPFVRDTTSIDWQCGECGFIGSTPVAEGDQTVRRTAYALLTVEINTYADCPIPDSDEEPFPSLPIEKAWAFVLDGHTFYVLNKVGGRTLVFDGETGQWHRWFTWVRPYWNMFRGIMWKGRTIAADAIDPKVWELDPTSELDEETYMIVRSVTGFLPVRGPYTYRQGAMRMTARRGEMDPEGSTVFMRFSDDGGNTWSRYYEVALQSGDVSKKIEFRSLGRMRAPGRIWELSDTGGLIRIEGLDSDMELPDEAG